MTIKPLFTEAELDAKIAAYKQALESLASSQSYTIDVGGTKTTVTKADLPQIRSTLEWLQAERVKLTTGGGPQILHGVVRRG